LLENKNFYFVEYTHKLYEIDHQTNTQNSTRNDCFLFLFYFFVSRHEVYSVNTRCA